jgi:F-type H+-transporting ATPase subunit b
MPQIDQIGTIYFSQLIWLLVVFGLIYFIIGRWMLPRIEGTIHARNDKIKDDLVAAERARAEAETIETRYNSEMASAHDTARGEVQTATTNALRETEARLKDSQAAVEAKIATATADLDTARSGALGQIEAAAAEAVRDIVKLVSGIDIDEATAARAVSREFAEGAR